MTKTRVLWLISMVLLAPLLLPAVSEARCMRLTVEQEAPRAVYIFEGTYLGPADNRGYRFRVTARWKGSPPAEVVVHQSGRGVLAMETDVGTTYLIFATRWDGDPNLHAARCGSSARLAQSSATTAALTRLGLSRAAR